MTKKTRGKKRGLFLVGSVLEIPILPGILIFFPSVLVRASAIFTWFISNQGTSVIRFPTSFFPIFGSSIGGVIGHYIFLIELFLIDTLSSLA